MVRQFIIKLVDFFYPPFKRLLPLHTFRYAACGGANVLLDIALFFVFFHYVYQKQVLDLGFIAFKPHIASFLSSFVITFPIGFLLSKYIVWSGSTTRGHVQLFRYFLIVMVNLLLNYVLLKLFVEILQFYPTIAKILTTVVVVIFSFFSQKHFTFKVKAPASSPKEQPV